MRSCGSEYHGSPEDAVVFRSIGRLGMSHDRLEADWSPRNRRRANHAAKPTR